MTQPSKINSVAAFALALCYLLPLPTQAYNGVRNKCPRNCYPMLMMRVLDGDSVQGYIHTNDRESVIYTTLRIEGIDTPETRGAQCQSEELRGMKAKLYLKGLLDPLIKRQSANLACACDYRGGKFAKRRVGSLKIKRTDRWQDVTRFLFSRCLAVPYDKGQRPNWCQCLDKGICPDQFFNRRSCKKAFSKYRQ